MCLLQELGVASFNLMTSSAKRRRVGPDVEVTEEGVVEMLVMYDRREFPVDKTPKTSLYIYSRCCVLAQNHIDVSLSLPPQKTE